MFPAVSNRLICDCIPGILSHLNCLKKTDLKNIVFSRFIQINCPGAELSSVMCLEASDDPSVEWLDVRCEIGLEKFDSDIGGLIRDIMGTKIIKKQKNLPLFSMHLCIHLLDVSERMIRLDHEGERNFVLFKYYGCHPSLLITTIIYSHRFRIPFHKAPRFGIFSNKKWFHPFATIRVAGENDSNSGFVFLFATHLF